MAPIRRERYAVVRKTLGVSVCGIVALAVVSVGMGPFASARTVKPKKPGPPTGVTAQSIDQGAVVSWGPPASDGGSTVTGYSVSVGAGAKAKSCTTTSATTCTVTGLIDGRQYRAKVRATNSVGQGKASLSASFTPGQSPDCANLVPGANLEYCNFHDADLDGLNLAGADFFAAKLVGASFEGTDLAGAIFGGNTQAQSDLTEVDFSGADMTGADLAETYMYLTGFDGTNLTDASFDGATLIAVDFDDAVLTGSSLDQADLTQLLEFSDTTCPDGTNSDNRGGTCL